MSMAISQASPYYQHFLAMGITEFSGAGQLTPTAASKKRYEEQKDLYQAAETSVPQSGLPPHNASQDDAQALQTNTPGKDTLPIWQGLSGGDMRSYMNFLLEKSRLGGGFLEADTPSGVHVTVERTWVGDKADDDPTYRVTLSRDGEQVKEFLTKTDVRVTELENGEFEILALAEEETTLAGTDGNDILISRTASQVLAGEGDDTVFVMGSGTYEGGNGNDQFILGGRGYPRMGGKCSPVAAEAPLFLPGMAMIPSARHFWAYTEPLLTWVQAQIRSKVISLIPQSLEVPVTIPWRVGASRVRPFLLATAEMP